MKKTGNYLEGNSPHEKRNKGDFYQTPLHCTRLLLDNEQFTGSLLEPACGGGAISCVLAERGIEHTARDLSLGQDFLSTNDNWDNIITNPPYRLSGEFIAKAKSISNKVAMLLPLNYLSGQKRFETVFQDREFPLTKVYVFTRYLMMSDTVRDDGTCGFGMITFAWFLWERGSTVPQPAIHWLDNNEYIRK